jgi:hypothetical protein
MHVAPLLPQLAAESPAWHWPVESVQPVLHAGALVQDHKSAQGRRTRAKRMGGG